MTDTRAEIQERALATVDDTFPVEMLTDATDEEIEAALDDYQRELNLEKRAEYASRMYVTSEILRRVMVERGIMFEYSKRWPDTEDVDDRLSLDNVAEEAKKDFVAAIEEAEEQAPIGYAELVEGYVALTGGLLDDMSYVTHGDPVAGEDVRVVCEHDDRQFEAVLETADRRADVDGLGELLNRVVAETTDADRRFCWTDVDLAYTVGVWFVEDVPCQMLDAYYAGALNSAMT